MPVNLKQNNLKYKDSQTGLYKSIDVVGEQLTFDAEAYATGYRNGVKITDSNDGAYQNNAKYYRDLAENFKNQAEEAARTLMIDDTLTQTGQPADAKKTGDEVTNLRDDLNDYLGIQRPIWITGECYNAPSSVTSLAPDDTTEFPTYSCTYISVNPGDVVKITGTGGSGAKLWVWTKLNNSIISRADSNVTLTDEILVAPQDAAWLLCSAITNNPHYLIKGKTVDERINNVSSNIQNNITKFLNILPSDYENKLAKINVPCSFSIAGNSSWEDLPDNTKAYVFTQIRYSNNHMLQIVYEYPSLISYTRIVVPSTGNIVYDWKTNVDSTLTQQNMPADALATGNAILSINNNATRFLSVSPANYENKLAKINVPCSFSIAGNSSWEDLPDNTKAYVFIQFKYSNQYMLQIVYEYPSLTPRYRIVAPSTGNIVYDWKANVDSTLTKQNIPADALATGNAILSINNNVTKFLSVSPANYENKLAKINVPCSFSIAGNSSWEDLPDNTKAYVFTQTKYSDQYMLQTVHEYPSLIPYYRIVAPSTGNIVYDWRINVDSTLTQQNMPADALATGNAILSINNNVTKFLSVNSTNYENKLAKINVPCSFSIAGNSSWEDLPDNTKAYVFTQTKCSNNHMLQTVYEYPSLIPRYRVVVPSTGNIVYDWRINVDSTLTQQNMPADALATGNAILSINNNVTKFLSVNPTNYENKLAKINVPCSFSIADNSSWEDLPIEDSSYIFTQFKYSSQFMLQTAYKYPSLIPYTRIVSPSTGVIIQDWRVGVEKKRTTVYYAIGDSITAGSYSENGSGYAVRDAEWSYPNQLAKIYGITAHNLGIPGAKITEFITQAQQVGSDATLVTIMGGVNDYGSDTAMIGSIDDTSEAGTIIGALKNIITTICEIAPSARIVLIAPMPQKAGSINTRYSLNYKRKNFTFEELFVALKTVAEYYNIELLDCMHSGPVNMLNITTVLSDATHPTKTFFKTVTEWMGAHLL